MFRRSLVFTRSRSPLLDLPIRAFEGGTAGHVHKDTQDDRKPTPR